MIGFTTAEDLIPIEKHRCLRRVYDEDATDGSSVRRGSIALRAAKRTLVTGPAKAQLPPLRRRRPKPSLMC